MRDSLIGVGLFLWCVKYCGEVTCATIGFIKHIQVSYNAHISHKFFIYHKHLGVTLVLCLSDSNHVDPIAVPSPRCVPACLRPVLFFPFATTLLPPLRRCRGLRPS